MLGTSFHFFALLMTANTWFHLQKRSSVRASWLNGSRILAGAFAIQVIATLALVVSALQVETPEAFYRFLRKNNIFFICIGSSIAFSVCIALNLLYNGYTLQKTLKQSILDGNPVQTSIFQMNMVLGTIVGFTLLRAIVYTSWLIDREIWNQAGNYLWFYALHTILPVAVNTLSLLWLFRRKSNRSSRNDSQNHEHCASIIDIRGDDSSSFEGTFLSFER